MSTTHSNTLAPAGPAMWWDGGERAITAREKARIEEHGPSCFSIALVPATPSARWAADALADPHGDRYACERAALTLGNLTDDELANAVFLHGNEQPTMADLAAGKALAGIVYLTAAKERIRWLSRVLEATCKQPLQVGEVQGDALSLAEHITDHLCHHEYDIGGRSELLACVTQALAAQAGQGAVPCATSASHALRVAYRHLDMVSMRVSHCKDAAIIESAMKDVDTFDLNAAISALADRQPGAQMPVDDDWHLRGYAYASKQATTCAGCGKHKHTPLRIDAMGGHVCLTCIDQKLGVLLGEFGYPPAQGIDLGQQRPLIARSLAEWHEDDGNVMWWAWCGRDWAGEPAWCGTPNDSDWPGYHTHWTQHPSQPALTDQRDAAPGVANA